MFILFLFIYQGEGHAIDGSKLRSLFQPIADVKFVKNKNCSQCISKATIDDCKIESIYKWKSLIYFFWNTTYQLLDKNTIIITKKSYDSGQYSVIGWFVLH